MLSFEPLLFLELKCRSRGEFDMAILDHFEATIRVNGETAREYDAENKDGAKPATVVKYIEAISDAQFSFHFVLRRTYESKNGLLVCLRVDGHRLGGMVLLQADTSATRSGGDRAFERHSLRSTSNGKTWKMPFKFSAVVSGLFLYLFKAFQ